MLDIKFIKENTELVKRAAKNKKQDSNKIDEALAFDSQRVALITEIDKLRAQKNNLTKDQIQIGKEVKEKLKELEPKLKEIEGKLSIVMRQIPNVPFDDVPLGKDDSENVVLRKWGTPHKFGFEPKDHMALGEYLGIIDTNRAAKVTGSRFGYILGDLAFLEIALVQFVFKSLTDEEVITKIADAVEKGYSHKPFTPVIPPVMIKPEVFIRMARLDPGQEEERYFLPKDELYLVGSAEHTLGPLHMDEIVEESKFPLRYVGFSSCFRREAGSYGKDIRGILRVHQFDKIEMESFTTKENSLKEQNFLVGIQEYLMQSLEIPYQVVMICTGDMGGPDARQIDIEAWLPSQNKYRETHTSDLMTDYQSRRLNTRVKRAQGNELCHMNDATCAAIGRTLIAILENYQNKDGSVMIPTVLRSYIGKDVITPKGK